MRPIHLCCVKDEYRPAMEHFQVLRNKVIATNGHAVIVLPVDEVFGENIIEDDEELYFNAEEWKKSKIFNAKSISREGNVFTGQLGRSSTQITALTPEQFSEKTKGGHFPQYETVFPINAEQKPIKNIALHPESLISIMKCFDSTWLEFKFYDIDRAILITNYASGGIGLMMPTMVEPCEIDISNRLGLTDKSWEDLL